MLLAGLTKRLLRGPIVGVSRMLKALAMGMMIGSEQPQQFET
jgi:hypothetical protein